MNTRECIVRPGSTATCDRGTTGCEVGEHCNCNVPALEGMGQHAPGCGIFTAAESERNRGRR